VSLTAQKLPVPHGVVFPVAGFESVPKYTLAACGDVLTLSGVNAVVPPHSLPAVLLGAVALEVMRFVIFHSLTRLAPVATPDVPTPTNSRSVVPSKNVTRGEHVLFGFVPALMLRLSDTAGVVFITPVVAENDNAYKLGLVALFDWVPQAYRVAPADFGPLAK
jgi:hypothetical protein